MMQSAALEPASDTRMVVIHGERGALSKSSTSSVNLMALASIARAPLLTIDDVTPTQQQLDDPF